MSLNPGLLILLGSGETQPTSRKVHQHVLQSLPEAPHVAILETPAGFEPNSAQVAEKIKAFMEHRLQNYSPQISVIPARKRGTYFSPDNAEILQPLLQADEILLGPGSPTYAARQLKGSVAVDLMAARHRLGTAVFLSSSATLAFGAYTLPVYEIYKVGADLHWQPGINFLAPFALFPVIIPHWNNQDGGDQLDTSRCYVGRDRFQKLRSLLPAGSTILGIDEHTAVIIEFNQGCCRVIGKGGATILTDTKSLTYQTGDEFSLDVLGDWHMPAAGEGIASDIWQAALDNQSAQKQTESSSPVLSDAVQALVAKRQQARERNDWSLSDALRDEIAQLGWEVRDTPSGPDLVPIE